MKPAHKERVRLLLERAEREALRSAIRDLVNGTPDSAADALFAVELIRRLREGAPLPARTAPEAP